MKIEKVEIRRVEMPLVGYFETSFGREDIRHAVIVGVHGEGLDGYGEAPVMEYPGYSYETVGTAWHVIKEYFAPMVMKKAWETPKELADALEFYKGHPMAKCGLEGAVWDLYGRQQGKSLAELIGSVKKKVPTGVSIGIQKDVKTLLDLIAGYLEEGYQRIKVKIKPGWDIKVLQEIRKNYPRIMLMADANSAYKLEDTPLFLEMEPLDLMMIEQPLEHDDIIDHAELQKQLRTPICLDESILNPEDARKAHSLGSCRIINIKVGRVGGLTRTIKLHDICQNLGIPVWCGGMLETGIGRAQNLAIAAMSNFTIPGDTSASKRYYHEDIVDEPAVLNPDGTIDVPTRPGNGVNVVTGLLDKYTTYKEVICV
ncbi:MAG: o-succinylbenzoate synthase [Bacillota bacterium]